MRKEKYEGKGGCVMDIRRYDIIQVDLGEPIGSEQGGIRPAVVVQNNTGNTYSSTTIVLPLTKEIKKLYQPTHTLIRKNYKNGLKYDSMVEGEQIRVVSHQRILRKCGRITDESEKKEIRRVYNASFGED